MRRARVSPVYAHTHNGLLNFFLQAISKNERIPTQHELAVRCGASPTTVHRILCTLKKHGILEGDGPGLRLVRRPTKKDFFPQPSVLSRREEVENSLIRMLVEGRLKPGERFSELALAREHAVTTGTVREALLKLSSLGVFTKSERKQWEVARLDGVAINDLIDIRILLETYALGRHFDRGAVLLDAFNRIHQETKALANMPNPDREEFFRLDTELHRTIIESGSNRYLVDQFRYASFPIQIQMLHYGFDASLQQLGLRQHLLILDAIIEGDRTKAMVALEAHLEESRRTLLRFDGGAVTAPLRRAHHSTGARP